MKHRVIILVLLIVSSCNYIFYSKYDEKFNGRREQIGLPDLPTSWWQEVPSTGTTYDGYNYIIWAKPYEGWKHYPYLLSKTVVYGKDTIVEERNEYIGATTYTTGDGTFNDEVDINYNFIDGYVDGEELKYGWDCRKRNKETWEERSLEKISVAEADSILHRWGLSRR